MTDLGDFSRQDVEMPAAVRKALDLHEVTELEKWWVELARTDAAAAAKKAAAYGSNSLTQLGHHIARLQGRVVDDETALELGCWVNIVQKVERMTDAVLRGERPDDDSVHDTKVYSTMIERIRTTGTWP